MNGPRPIGLSTLGLVSLLSAAGAAGLSALGGWPNPMTARGDLVYQGDAGAARVALGTDASVLTSINGRPVWVAQTLTATGAALQGAASATAARAVLFPYPVDLTTADDWTTSSANPAGSSVSVAAGVVTVTFASGGSCDFTSGGCSTDAARAQRSIPHYDAASWSVRARLTSVTSSAAFVPMFGVMTGTSWATSTAKYVIYFAANSDSLVFARIAASGATIGGATVASIRGGQGWLRLDCAGRTIVAYGGVGSGGAEPTAWTVISSVAITATDPMPQRFFVSAHDSSASPAPTITWDLVRLQPVE